MRWYASRMARTRGRWVRWLKWSAIVLSAVTLVVWVGSAWWAVFYLHANSMQFVAAGGGRLTVSWDPAPRFNPAVGSWSVERWTEPFVWWGVWASTKAFAIPLWNPLPFTLGAAFYLWRRDRRARLPGHCPACGYDLAGLSPGGPCPECGKAPAPAT